MTLSALANTLGGIVGQYVWPLSEGTVSLLKQRCLPYGLEDDILSNSAISGGRSRVTISQRMSKSTLSLPWMSRLRKPTICTHGMPA